MDSPNTQIRLVSLDNGPQVHFTKGVDGILVSFESNRYPVNDGVALERAIELLFDDGYGEVAIDAQFVLVFESDPATGFVLIWIKNIQTGKEVVLNEFSEREAKKLKKLFATEVV